MDARRPHVAQGGSILNAVSKSQVDQLGERIRKNGITEADLQLLDFYRRSFARAYDHVVTTIRNDLGFEPTGRPTKSTTSIADKLARESLRLSQMQDIAGCRIVVADIIEQDALVDRLTEVFETKSLFDRRESSSHGYRAVHVVVRHMDMPIEIQIRTAFQHLWAELSEKLSDLVEPAVKYGGGPEALVEFLLSASERGRLLESFERRLDQRKDWENQREEIADLAKLIEQTKRELADLLQDMIGKAHLWKRV